MRKIKRQLLVSYTYSNGFGNFGFGNTTQFTTDKKRIAPSEIREMEEIMRKEKGFESLAVLNVQFM